MQSRYVTSLVFAGAVAVATGALAARPGMRGSEGQANTYTAGKQHNSSVAVDSAGNFVVVWESPQDGSGRGIIGQRYDAAGSKVGGEFQVNTFTTLDQYSPAVAMDGTGRFVVAWQSTGCLGAASTTLEICAQIYDAAGVKVGTEFRINGTTANTQAMPALAMDSAGGFVVVWQSRGGDGSGYGVIGKRFNSAGQGQGGEFTVNQTAAEDQNYPEVARTGAGAFVVAWQSYKANAAYYDVFARRYDASGSAQGSEFRVNSSTSGAQGFPDVAVDSSGNFVVIWSGCCPQNAQTGIFGQRYSSAGAAQGSNFVIETFPNSPLLNSVVSRSGTGGFVVTWERWRGECSQYGILGQAFDGSGAAQGNRFLVNSYTAGSQYFPALAMNSTGDYVVAWSSWAQDGSQLGVFGQRFCASPPADITDLHVERVGSANLHLGWTDVAGATDYLVYEDPQPCGGFGVLTGIAANGTIGLTIPLPSGSRDYSVVPRAAGCEGLKR